MDQCADPIGCGELLRLDPEFFNQPATRRFPLIRCCRASPAGVDRPHSPAVGICKQNGDESAVKNTQHDAWNRRDNSIAFDGLAGCGSIVDIEDRAGVAPVAI